MHVYIYIYIWAIDDRANITKQTARAIQISKASIHNIHVFYIAIIGTIGTSQKRSI